MLRLRRPSGLCSRTLSDPANRLLKRTDSEGSSSAAEKKSSAVPFFAAVTCRQSAPDSLRERGDSQEGGNRRCLPSCAPARRQRKSPAAGRGESPRSAERNFSLDFKRKTSRLERGEHAYAVRVPRSAGAEKKLPPGQNVALRASYAPESRQFLKTKRKTTHFREWFSWWKLTGSNR